MNQPQQPRENVLEVRSRARAITVVLVEDHSVVRQAIGALLSRDSDIKVVGEASRSAEALELISVTKPDVVLLDVRLGKGNGFHVARAMKDVSPDSRVLVLTGYDSAYYIKSLLSLGVAGYLLKTASSEELTRAIHEVAAGGMALAPEVQTKLLGLVRQSDSGARDHPQGIGRLTRRESETLRYLRMGFRNREIARAMGVAQKTVEAHIQRVLSKLGVRSRLQAVLKSTQESGLFAAR